MTDIEFRKAIHSLAWNFACGYTIHWGELERFGRPEARWGMSGASVWTVSHHD